MWLGGGGGGGAAMDWPSGSGGHTYGAYHIRVHADYRKTKNLLSCLASYIHFRFNMYRSPKKESKAL